MWFGQTYWKSLLCPTPGSSLRQRPKFHRKFLPSTIWQSRCMRKKNGNATLSTASALVSLWYLTALNNLKRAYSPYQYASQEYCEAFIKLYKICWICTILNCFISMFRNNLTSIVSWENTVHVKWGHREIKACSQFSVNLDVWHVV